MAKIDWDQLVKWDRDYYMHITDAMEEWVPFCVDRTEGCYITDDKGNKILDMMSGWICTNMGYRHPKVIEAIKEALENYGWLPETYITPYKAEAAKLIVDDILGQDKWAGRVRFVNGGSEAIEEAFIITKLYTNRPNVVTREYVYHGWTEGAASSVGLRIRRSTLTSPTTSEIKDVPGIPASGFFFAPAPHCYRCPLGNEYPDCKVNGKLRCVSVTEGLIKTIGPETVAAMIAEVQINASAITQPPEYIPQIRKMTKDLGVLWIDDEVATGFCRTGKWFAYQHYDVTPDIMATAKGITSALLPAGAVVVSKDIAKQFDMYRWNHAVTFAAHPVVTAAIVANIKAMMEEKILDHVVKMGRYLGERLKELQDRHKCVGNVDGMGLFWGMELVRNKETKEPFVKEDRYATYAGDISNYPANIVSKKCLEKGALFGGFVPNTLRIAPPLIITEKEVDDGIEALEYALAELDKMC